MSLLIQSAQIIDPSSPFHGERKNVFIKKGLIQQISDELIEADTVIKSNNLKLSPGWMDFRAFLAEPGFEHLETIASGTQAAAQGGFTALACMPNTNPTIQNKEVVRSLKSGNEFRVTDVFPIAALSKNTKGKELTELLDLHTAAGVTVFGDGNKAIANTSLLVKALQYNQLTNCLTIDFPQDETLFEGCQVHESIQSTTLGLKSSPAFHETIRINRDIEILRYTGGRLHLSNISTKEGVNLIREAKAEGLQLSCDVAISHLAFNELMLLDFDTNAKVNPPLRELEDQIALWNAVFDGTIDVIASNHLPSDEEGKKLEFDLADFGMSSLEVFLPMLLNTAPIKKWDRIYDAIVKNPRKLTQLPVPQIKEGEQANITLFDDSQEWEYNASFAASLSKNSPLYAQKLKGKIIATIKGENQYINHV